MHDDFKDLLNRITPKKGVLTLLDGVLKQTIQNKDNIQIEMYQAKDRRISEIENEIDGLSASISKLTNIDLIRKLEEKRANLNSEKEVLEEQIQNKILAERDFFTLYNRIQNIIEDPLSIWESETTELKILLIGVLFGGKLYYTKKEGYQTPLLSALYAILNHLDDGKVPSGAGDETRTRNNLLGRQKL